MTYMLDPYGYWEKGWELFNPEPFPEPTVRDEYRLRWRTEDTIARAKWHRNKWEAFKMEFPDWKEQGLADEFRGKKP